MKSLSPSCKKWLGRFFVPYLGVVCPLKKGTCPPAQGTAPASSDAGLVVVSPMSPIFPGERPLTFLCFSSSTLMRGYGKPTLGRVLCTALRGQRGQYSKSFSFSLSLLQAREIVSPGPGDSQGTAGDTW